MPLPQRGTYQIDRALMDVSHVAMQVNLAKEAAQLESQIRREVRKLVAEDRINRCLAPIYLNSSGSTPWRDSSL